MKHIFITVFFALLSHFVIAQKLSVKSFSSLETDLDARVYYSKLDQNGEKCAIIKVITTKTGFSFDVGALGIVAVEQKKGEIWVYVPRGVQRMTINHPNLGVLRNYVINIPIESAKVYEMELITAEIEILVKDIEIESQWVTFKSVPSNADVYVNDQLVGKTPLNRKFPKGEYKYRIERPKYYTNEGEFDLKDEKKIIDVKLNQKYGSITVDSEPDRGMMVYLDDENTGLVTPVELNEISSGNHKITLSSEWYETQFISVNVNDNQNSEVIFKMKPAFALVKIKTSPRATIFIDDEEVGKETCELKLLSGVYTVKATQEGYKPKERLIEIKKGENQEITLELSPRIGSIDISTFPIEAKITLNKVDYGTSPSTIKNLIIGTYDLILEKEGFAAIKRKIIVEENKTTVVEETFHVDENYEKKLQFKTETKNIRIIKNIALPLSLLSAGASWLCYEKSKKDFEKYKVVSNQNEAVKLRNSVTNFSQLNKAFIGTSVLGAITFMVSQEIIFKRKKTIGLTLNPTPNGIYLGYVKKF